MEKLFARFFVGELLVIGVAVLSFRFIPERIFAGVVAGSAFSALGFWIFFEGIRKPALRGCATFWIGCIHLFGVALPMMMTRLLNHREEFKDVSIWGLPGPVFHQLSTVIYMVLLVATAVDAIRSLRAAKRQGKTARPANPQA